MTKTKPKATLLEILATADTSAIRVGQLNGREHLIVPVVALVEGVLHSANAEDPELALASEFARYPDAWNGRPLVMNHPQVDGDFVSANSPEVLEEWAFGKLFNTRLEDNKLKTEAWIDTLAVAASDNPDIQQTVDRINNGEIVEVSTGLFATVEQLPGKFNGEAYAGIWRSVAPDHLALLAEGCIGACSVEDGAGAPRLNVLRSAFDNPLGVVSGTATTTADDVSAKSDGANDMPKIFNQERALLDRATARLDTLIPNSFPSDMPDNNVRTLLRAAFEKQGVDLFHIYSFTQDSVVYERWDSFNVFRQGFNIASEEEGAVLDGEEVHVLMLTKIVAAAEHPADPDEEEEEEEDEDDDPNMNQASKGKNMAKKANAQPDPIEGDAGEPTTAAPVTESTDTVTEEFSPPGVADLLSDPPAEEPAVQTADEYIEEAPEEIQEVLRDGMRLHTERKNSIIRQLLTNDRNDYTEDELQVMKIRDLERIGKLANVPTYIGKGVPVDRTNADDNAVPPPPEAFPIKKA